MLIPIIKGKSNDTKVFKKYADLFGIIYVNHANLTVNYTMFNDHLLLLIISVYCDNQERGGNSLSKSSILCIKEKEESPEDLGLLLSP